MLSKELLIPINNRVKVTQAAKIHDIGKWIIPKEVLDADRELTSDERTKYVEKHPEIGAKMLIDAGFPNWLANLVRDHHREKNSGYPKIDDYLTFCAQILHVADVAVSVGAPDENHKYVHDASIKKALNVLEKPSFNQEIVDAFKRLVSSKKLPSIFKLQAA
jgi:HD-GYP domain-containing protein (c-di-GMP phosphodiesterase class II)